MKKVSVQYHSAGLYSDLSLILFIFFYLGQFMKFLTPSYISIVDNPTANITYQLLPLFISKKGILLQYI